MSRLAVLMTLLALPNLAWSADPVGRVIFAVGEVRALRGNLVLPLAREAAIESGDEIVTGKTSSVQIRFSDSSIVALRAETRFRVDDFAYKGTQDGSEKALFRLLKGGLRTITGAIGRLNRDNYGVVTPTSTIGVRGTHYNLVVCADDCRNTDGSMAPNGTYGGVTEGRISSTPLADPGASREFAKGEYFFAPNAVTAPQQLLVPPAFLADKLEAQQRSPAPAAATQASGSAPAASSAAAATTIEAASSVDSSVATDTAATIASTTALPSVATETLTSAGTSAYINTITGFIATYYDGTNYVSIDSCGNTSGGCGTNSVSQFSNSGIWLTGYANDGGAPKASLSGGTVVDAGSVQLNGTMFAWGRWTGGFLVTDAGGNTFSNLPSGLLFGMTDDPSVGGQGNVWPTSGMVSYSLAGGPRPVDTAGNVGTMNSMSGTLDFVTRNVTFNASMSFAIPVQGAANLTLSGGGTIINFDDNLRNASISGSCAGTGCASASAAGQLDARFAGTAAQVMVVNGIVQNAVKDSSGSGTNSVLFLDVLKCTSGC